jgi:hypothetical protein
MPTRSRILVAAALATALLLTGCTPPEPRRLTAGDKNEMCESLHNSVVVAAATAVYSPVYLYRAYGPALPEGHALPYPDCAYLARSEFAERTEVFYFGPAETLLDELIDQLSTTGFQEQGDRWVLLDADGQPHAIARIEQFYTASDAGVEFRPYAELIGRPAVILSITSRRY